LWPTSHYSNSEGDGFLWCRLRSKVDKFFSDPTYSCACWKSERTIIKECPVNLECQVKQVIALGSHDLFFWRGGGPLIWIARPAWERASCIDKAKFFVSVREQRNTGAWENALENTVLPKVSWINNPGNTPKGFNRCLHYPVRNTVISKITGPEDSFSDNNFRRRRAQGDRKAYEELEKKFRFWGRKAIIKKQQIRLFCKHEKRRVF